MQIFLITFGVFLMVVVAMAIGYILDVYKRQVWI